MLMDEGVGQHTWGTTTHRVVMVCEIHLSTKMGARVKLFGYLLIAFASSGLVLFSFWEDLTRRSGITERDLRSNHNWQASPTRVGFRAWAASLSVDNGNVPHLHSQPVVNELLFRDQQNQGLPVIQNDRESWQSLETDQEFRYSCLDECAQAYIERAQELDLNAGIQLRNLFCKASNYSVSRKPLIVGAGAGTTGTQAIAYAASLLGLRVIHFTEMWNPWGKRNLTFGDKSSRDPAMVIGQYGLWSVEKEASAEDCLEKGREVGFSQFEAVDAVFDSPFPEYAYDLFRSFPNSRVILTVRDPPEWLRHRLAHHPGSNAHYLRPCGVRLDSFHPTIGEGLFRATNDWVACVSPSDRLLKIDLFRPYRERDMWDQLMRLVGVQNVTLREFCEFPREPGALVCGNWTFFTHQGNAVLNGVVDDEGIQISPRIN